MLVQWESVNFKERKWEKIVKRESMCEFQRESVWVLGRENVWNYKWVFNLLFIFIGILVKLSSHFFFNLTFFSYKLFNSHEIEWK